MHQILLSSDGSAAKIGWTCSCVDEILTTHTQIAKVNVQEQSWFFCWIDCNRLILD